MAYILCCSLKRKFSEDVKLLLDDDEYRKLQVFLAMQPDYGDLIQNTGGLRKIRWLAGGKEIRVIYFHRTREFEIAIAKES
jgi:hypothetical protein